jgi:hypothetical protein
MAMKSVRTWNTRGTEPVISGRRLLKLDTVDALIAGFEDNTRYNKSISGNDHSRRRPVPSVGNDAVMILFNTMPALFIDVASARHLGLSQS